MLFLELARFNKLAYRWFKTLRSNGEGTWSAVVLPTSSADIHLLTPPLFSGVPATVSPGKNLFLFFFTEFRREHDFNVFLGLAGVGCRLWTGHMVHVGLV